MVTHPLEADQRDVATTQRAIDKRLLPVAGDFQDLRFFKTAVVKELCSPLPSAAVDPPWRHRRSECPCWLARLHRDRLGIAVGGKPCIDRDQVVGAGNLEAVAGTVDDGDVGLVCNGLEAADRALEFEVADIEMDLDRVEAGVAKHRCDRTRVVTRDSTVAESSDRRRCRPPAPRAFQPVQPASRGSSQG